MGMSGQICAGGSGCSLRWFAAKCGTGGRVSYRTRDIFIGRSACREIWRTIDGKHIWQYVAEQAQIAEHYRDQGHPQFWGRLAGTSGDVEDAQWLVNKYKQIGLTDTRLQTVDFFNPQWSAQSWSVTAASGAETVPLTSAEPSYGSPDTGGKTLDLEVVYVGLGSEADFARRDVRGKAILFVKAQPSYQAGPADILKRAEDHGAAALLSTDTRGGNVNAQSYRAYTNISDLQHRHQG